MQTFAVVVWDIQPDVRWFWNGSKVLHQDMVNAAPLRFVIAKHGVVGMAGKAGMFARHEVVLEVCRGEIALVVYMETLAKVGHYMTGEAELR